MRKNLHSILLLLYPQIGAYSSGVYIFTFHYASTLSACLLWRDHMHIHLHSILLLLYRVWRRSAGKHYANLHSTMLPLYPNIAVLWKIANSIYIPLCFYFIQERLWQCSHISYLHSTMLLLYHILNTIFFYCFFIYIPLCFYFIWSGTPRSFLQGTFTFHYASTLSKSWNSGQCSDVIYIPLCFYFITVAPLLISILVKFTFHYASTLSANGSCYSQASYKFTFHYASTLSFCKLLAVFGNKHLHSTLLLLYQRSSGSSVYRREHAFTFHFASTLSWRMAQAYAPSFQFTFHYASTLSRACWL